MILCKAGHIYFAKKSYTPFLYPTRANSFVHRYTIQYTITFIIRRAIPTKQKLQPSTKYPRTTSQALYLSPFQWNPRPENTVLIYPNCLPHSLLSPSWFHPPPLNYNSNRLPVPSPVRFSTFISYFLLSDFAN